MSFCPTCGKEVQADSAFCSNCGHALKQVLPAQTAQKVSRWWWLLPIFFTIIGGVVAYVANREKNANKARAMLIVGILIIPIIIIAIPAGILLADFISWLMG